ncbi:hypothetical protein R1flu_028443 [Riccia fluitans]|uniref:Uncharacterized protein n=1 Tax=Riccia fluitans TaxID=41844 RepID=A0ABD1XLS5_9MARC
MSHPNLSAMRFHEVEEKGVREYFKLTKDKDEHYVNRQKGPAGVVVQIINDYLLCRGNMRRCSLPAVSVFLELMHYWTRDWVSTLAGGLAMAVKE